MSSTSTMTSDIEQQDPNYAIKRWQPLYADELSRVNALIVSKADSYVPLIPAVVQHLVNSGGKRIRPILTILSAKLFEYEGDRHINLATAIEFFHTATLLHDDVVDESQLRRGVPTVNNVWDNSVSVLVGDYLLSKAFQLISRDESPLVQQILSDSSAIITEGEVKQLIATNDLSTTQDNYIDIIASKTSQLFVAACHVGAVVARADENNQTALADFGRNLGTAFQIADDALDYSAKQQELGKTLGDDFREGKITLPIILSYANSTGEEKTFWERVMQHPEQQTDGDLEQALRYILDNNAIARSMDVAKDYAQKAKDDLRHIPDSDIKQALFDFLDFSVNRDY